MDYSEKWGVDVDEAVKLALIDLKLSRDEVEVTVLEEPSKGFFGIGSKLAKVRVEKKKPAGAVTEKKEDKKIADNDTDDVKTATEESRSVSAEKKEKNRAAHDAPRKERRKNGRRKKENREERTYAEPLVNIDPVNMDELTDAEEHEALTFLKEITDKMGLSLEFRLKTGEDVVFIEMSGKDSGTVIGKRGQTLDAIQYLTSLAVNKDSEKYIKVVIDAENYRSKRQKTLEQLALRLAGKVKRTKKYVRLEPMNPYERKIIHATLQHDADVITRSEGEEPYRRVIIELKK